MVFENRMVGVAHVEHAHETREARRAGGYSSLKLLFGKCQSRVAYEYYRRQLAAFLRKKAGSQKHTLLPLTHRSPYRSVFSHGSARSSKPSYLHFRFAAKSYAS